MSRGVTGLTQEEEYALLGQLRECQTELLKNPTSKSGSAEEHISACYDQVAEAIAAGRKVPVEVLKTSVPKAEVYSVETITAWLQFAKANSSSAADSPTLTDISNKLRSAEAHWRHVASRAGVLAATNGERTMAPATAVRVTGLSRADEDNLLAQLKRCQAEMVNKDNHQHATAASHVAACFQAVADAIAIDRLVTVEGLVADIPPANSYDVDKITGWIQFARANASSAVLNNTVNLPALADIANKLRIAADHWSYVTVPPASSKSKENVQTGPVSSGASIIV